MFYLIYKSFIRPYLDYGDILYNKPSNDNFQNKMEEVQYSLSNNNWWNTRNF